MAIPPTVSLDELREMPEAALHLRVAAGALGVDTRTVSRGIADGVIPAVKIGKRVLILREPLIRLLETDNATTANRPSGASDF